jgi:RimJ/RimL family protein N-acetyltransferase
MSTDCQQQAPISAADRHAEACDRATLMSLLREMTDGVVTIRPPEPDDSERLIAGRDDQWRRWLGPGSVEPRPTACIVAEGEVVGWVDFDTDRVWLRPGEVNVGYNVFAPHRGKGYASRAVELLIQHLDQSTQYETATLLIHPDNAASLAVAANSRFTPSGEVDGSRYFKRPVKDA